LFHVDRSLLHQSTVFAQRDFMKFRIACLTMPATILLIVATGCQSSRFSMPKLAFWKNNDQLASEYIEPPSHQFTPERTASADKESTLDTGDGPPTRPKTASTSGPSIDSFAEEVNRSWAQLEAKTQKKSNEVNQALVDTNNISLPPTGQGSEDLKQPLMPRYLKSDDRALAAKSAAESTGNLAGDGTFAPMPASKSSPATRYEQLAGTTMSGPSTLQPAPATSPGGRSEFSAESGFQPVAMTSRPSVAMEPQGRTAEPAPFNDSSRFENPYMPQLQAEKSPTSPVSAPNTPKSLASAKPADPVYQSTPYKPFTALADSATGSSPDTPVTENASGTTNNPPNTPRLAQMPLSLQLSGQGTYAPGSVRRPDSLSTAPQSGGGSFLR
jgi:hypothetical protein